MPPQSRGEADHPGAGTYFVYGLDPPDIHLAGPSRRSESASARRSRSRPASRGGSRSRERRREDARWPPEWDDVVKKASVEDPMITASPDAMLHRGVAEYTFIPDYEGGVLGRGKFSTVFKVKGTDGLHYALKHTALHPHHPLIAARLLREPTLLAQLSPHPCLIGVEGWVRTEGHFYLIDPALPLKDQAEAAGTEEYATSHVALVEHPVPLLPSRAAYILDQLVSVTRDCLHAGRVCHRDLKGENVLVDVNTGEILVLDLGLATHFSMSEAKLTTCCGSPAFHSPEIVNALNHPPGVISYYGPELDIWCIALTLLSLLLQVRFPLGPSHQSRYVMAERVLDRLQELDEYYPPDAPWRAMRNTGRSFDEAEQTFERRAWRRVRRAMKDFLEIDGVKRMESFAKYEIGEELRGRLGSWKGGKAGDSFKQVSFVPSEVKYTLPLHLLPPEDEIPLDDEGRGRHIVDLANPNGEGERRVLSYLKYLFRSSGILYHVVSASPSSPTASEPSSDATPNLLQLVLSLPPTPVFEPVQPRDAAPKVEDSWVSALFRRTGRSASVPPREKVLPSPNPSTGKKGRDAYLRCWASIEFHWPVNYRSRPRRKSTASSVLSSRSVGPKVNGRSKSASTSRNPLTRTITAPSLTTTAATPSGPSTPETALTSLPDEGGSRSPTSPSASASASASASIKTSPTQTTSQTLSAASAVLSRPPARRGASTSRLPRVREGPVPFSPLSRQVSLHSSSDDENGLRRAPSRALSRVPSRAGSRAPSRTNSGTSSAGSTRNDYGSRKASDPETLIDPSLSPEQGQGSTQGRRRRSKRAEPKVRIVLSDARAIPVIRNALNVKHMGSSEEGLGLPIRSPKSPISSPTPEETAEAEEERERGRPRSKEDRPTLLQSAVKVDEVNGQDGAAGGLMAPTARREVSRGRKLLEGLFGRAEERSASVPPLAWAPDTALRPMI